MPDYPIVDAWIQHPTSLFMRQPMFESVLRWMRLETVPDSVPLDLTIAALDAAQVEVAITTAWYAPSGAIISNDEVAAQVDTSKGRLRAVAGVDLRRPMEAVREIRRAVANGFVGVRMLPWLWELPPDDRRYYPVYSTCVELGIPFCTQVGHTGPLMSSEPGRPIPYLERVAIDFPELKIVAGHVGFPWTNEVISLARKFPNFYVDTSAYKAKRWPAELIEFLRGPGKAKVLFASDFPMITPSACFEGLDALELDPKTLRLLLRDTANAVFRLALP